MTRVVLPGIFDENIFMDEVFLISFGNYLFDKYGLKDEHGQPVSVTHADIQNWQGAVRDKLLDRETFGHGEAADNFQAGIAQTKG